MNPLLGHWYCSYCNDVVFLRNPWGRWDAKRGAACPVCRNNSADWVPAVQRISFERAHELFQEMREAIR